MNTTQSVLHRWAFSENFDADGAIISRNSKSVEPKPSYISDLAACFRLKGVQADRKIVLREDLDRLLHFSIVETIIILIIRFIWDDWAKEGNPILLWQ